MKNEKQCEIIKCLAAGMTIAETAKIHDLPETDVQNIAINNTEAIKEQREWMKEMGWIE